MDKRVDNVESIMQLKLSKNSTDRERTEERKKYCMYAVLCVKNSSDEIFLPKIFTSARSTCSFSSHKLNFY